MAEVDAKVVEQAIEAGLRSNRTPLAFRACCALLIGFEPMGTDGDDRRVLVELLVEPRLPFCRDTIVDLGIGGSRS